jgi:polygalacturonase
VSKTNGFTAWGVKIDTPANARNTDGIDPSGSKNVTITQSWIRDGDDNVAIKSGGAGPSTNISIVHNHFYYGHGMSIGSETFSGASKILVSDLTMDGTTSGIRIKSDVTRGGLVEGVTYENVCMRDIKRPIDISPFYEKNGTQSGNKIPVYRQINIRGVHDLTRGKVIMDSLDATHAGSIWLNGVEIDGIKPEDVEAQYGAFTLGPSSVNFVPGGPAVAVQKGSGATFAVPNCNGSFVPFPTI